MGRELHGEGDPVGYEDPVVVTGMETSSLPSLETRKEL